MTDYTELKRLVDRVLTDRRFCGDENHKALADAVQALIGENERLEVEVKRMTSIAYAAHGAFRMETLAQRDQLKVENEALRESNDKLTRRNGMLEQNVKVMTDTHILYTWLRKKCDQPSNDVVAVSMNIGHDWVAVHDLDRDLRTMIDQEQP